MSTMPIQRSQKMLAPPIKIPKAFDDPELVLSLVDKGAPYETITAVQKNPENENTPGWFRNFWALGGKVLFEGAQDLFYNPAFIEAAKASFQAEIIQPLAMMTNLNVPAPSSPPHLDLPFFRGTHQREVPGWILEPMGESGLFQEWAIPVASAISWFYEGTGGDFEYWPEGISAPSHTVSPPYSNTCVLSDSEYMYHRVGQMGTGDDYLMDGISSEALLHRTPGGWEIKHLDQSLHDYGDEQIRISILWKAFCFKDQSAADAFLDPAYNLTVENVVDIFCEDLRKRSVPFREPSDLTTDKDWMEVVMSTYRAPEGAAY
jgi:hypothetical protein